MVIKTRLFERYVDTGLMTQRELAQTLGMSHEHLSRLKHGRYNITPGFIARVCMALHAPRELLFVEEEPEAGTVATPGR